MRNMVLVGNKRTPSHGGKGKGMYLRRAAAAPASTSSTQHPGHIARVVKRSPRATEIIDSESDFEFELHNEL